MTHIEHIKPISLLGVNDFHLCPPMIKKKYVSFFKIQGFEVDRTPGLPPRIFTFPSGWDLGEAQKSTAWPKQYKFVRHIHDEQGLHRATIGLANRRKGQSIDRDRFSHPQYILWLDRVPNTDFPVSDYEAYVRWKNFYRERNGKHDVYWPNIVIFANLMSEWLAESGSIIQIAREAVTQTLLPELPNSGWAITVLYECWQYGKKLRSVPGYGEWCHDRK